MDYLAIFSTLGQFLPQSPFAPFQYLNCSGGHQSAIPGGVFRDCEKSGPAQMLNSLGALRGAEKTEAARRDAVGSSPWSCEQYTSVRELEEKLSTNSSNNGCPMGELR